MALIFNTFENFILPKMPRKLKIILYFFSLYSFAQSTPEVLIDSLNLTNDRHLKIELSKKIALALKDTDWDRAVKYLELAEKEALKTSSTQQDLASLYSTVASIYSSKDAFDIALDYYLKALEIYKGLGNKKEAMRVENNLAIIYAQNKNKEKALEYFLHVYNYQKSNKDAIQLVKILNNIGTIYLEKNTDSSLYYYKKANEINQNLNDNTLNVYIYTNLGRTYTLKNESSKANAFFKKAFSKIDTTTKPSLKSFVFYSYAQYNLQEKKYDSVITYATKALHLHKNFPYSFTTQKLSKILYRAYDSIQDYKNAVKYFQKYNTISDSINIEEKAVNIERIKLEEEYKVRTEIRALNEEKQHFKYYIAGLILVVGILVTFILMVKYRNKNIKNLLEQEKLKVKQIELSESLKTKNKVLIGKAMTEMHRTDSINEILNDLKAIKRKAVKKETQQAIDFILKRLQRDLNTDIWKEFELSFEQVHESFFNKLRENHPDLTPKDRRLCALLYLDLTTKEISQITGQSFKSVENARTRLRKKLELTNEKVNISTYLNSFSGN